MMAPLVFLLFGRGDAEDGESQQQLMMNSTPTEFLLFSVLRVSASPRPNKKTLQISS
jgi:hypothetical protein